MQRKIDTFAEMPMDTGIKPVFIGTKKEATVEITNIATQSIIQNTVSALRYLC